MVLGADGTFSADGLHTCLEDPRDLSFAPNAGRGTWTLHGPETLFPYQKVDLIFGPPENFSWLSWLADEEELFFMIGDPDAGRRCLFLRE